MKTITMYELLGLVKDGTQPNHIKYRGEEWWWGYDTYTYFADLERTPDVQANMFTRYVINYCLNDEVEILEEEKKIPEKINWKEKESMAGNLTKDKQIEVIARRTEHLKKSINETIDYLKSKGE